MKKRLNQKVTDCTDQKVVVNAWLKVVWFTVVRELPWALDRMRGVYLQTLRRSSQ